VDDGSAYAWSPCGVEAAERVAAKRFSTESKRIEPVGFFRGLAFADFRSPNISESRGVQGGGWAELVGDRVEANSTFS
jgi:hypothetical protein